MYYWTLRKIDEKYLKKLENSRLEWWTRSVKRILWKMKYYIESSKNSSYIKSKKCRVGGLVLSWIEAAFWNMSLLEKNRREQKGREDEKENLSCYSIASRTIEDTGTSKEKH